MNALQFIQKTDSDHLVIQVPEQLRGKELFITIQEKPIARRIPQEEYRQRLEDLRSVQFKGSTLYDSSEDEWYEQ